jgi:predicted transcriptional regulator
LITEHGEPSAYLVGVDESEFQKRRMKILEGIAKGERDIQDGRTFTHAEAHGKLSKWFD